MISSQLIYKSYLYFYNIESFHERYFGIVCKKSDTDDSFYMVGTIVRVID
jgi:hypothetical protein